MNLEAFILGSGGMMPLPRRFLTSVLLRREGELFLFDCGEATQISLKMLNLRWKKISRIFISHMHADHVTGLPGILMLSSQVERNEPLYIYGPSKIKEYVDANRKILEMFINYEIIVEEIESDGIIFENNEYSINCFTLKHTKPCMGFSLAEKDRPGVFYPDKARELNIPIGPLWADLQSGKEIEINGKNIRPEQVMGGPRSGRKFTYITDTKYFEKIAINAADSDLLICEGMFASNLIEDAAKKMHLTAEQAGTIARDAGGIKKMGLIHYSPRYVEKDLKEMLDEAKKIFPDTFLTRDRQHLTIPFDD